MPVWVASTAVAALRSFCLAHATEIIDIYGIAFMSTDLNDFCLSCVAFDTSCLGTPILLNGAVQITG